MKKRILSFLLILSIFILSACGNSGESNIGTQDDNGTIELTIWADDPNFNVPIMNKAVEMYENEDVDIHVEETTDYMTKLNTVLSSGTKDSLPNIVRIQDYDGRKFLESYPESFMEITEYIDYSDFAPYKEDIVSVDGKSYGVPFDSGVAGLFYRKDFFEEAGYTDEDLNEITWDRFIEIGKDIKEKTEKEVLGYGMPIEEETDTLRLLMQSVGEWYFDKNGDINLTNNEGIRSALLIMKELNDSGIVKGYADFNSRNEAILNENLASVAQGAWFGGTLKSIDNQSGLWGITTIPKINDIDNSVNASNQGGSSWYILDTGNEQENKAAIDFMMEIFAGNDNFYSEILEEHSAVSTYLPAQETETWQEKDDFFDGQKVNMFFSDSMNEIPQVPYGTQTSEVEDIFRTNLTHFYNEEMTVEELLQTVEDSFNTQFGF